MDLYAVMALVQARSTEKEEQACLLDERLHRGAQLHHSTDIFLVLFCFFAIAVG